MKSNKNLAMGTAMASFRQTAKSVSQKSSENALSL
jgi:hypothetical protein